MMMVEGAALVRGWRSRPQWRVWLGTLDSGCRPGLASRGRSVAGEQSWRSNGRSRSTNNKTILSIHSQQYVIVNQDKSHKQQQHTIVISKLQTTKPYCHFRVTNNNTLLSFQSYKQQYPIVISKLQITIPYWYISNWLLIYSPYVIKWI